METSEKITITVEAIVNSPISKVWESWIDPKHITQWCQASPEWHVPFAENDLRLDGRFKTTMAARDGSVSFDFTGVYTKVKECQVIEYVIDDGRKVKVSFSENDKGTKVIESFEAESINPIERQKEGWQAILDSFKNYTESL